MDGVCQELYARRQMMQLESNLDVRVSRVETELRKAATRPPPQGARVRGGSRRRGCGGWAAPRRGSDPRDFDPSEMPVFAAEPSTLPRRVDQSGGVGGSLSRGERVATCGGCSAERADRFSSISPSRTAGLRGRARHDFRGAGRGKQSPAITSRSLQSQL